MSKKKEQTAAQTYRDDAAQYLKQARAAINEALSLLEQKEHYTAQSYLNTGLKAYADGMHAVAAAIRRT